MKKIKLTNGGYALISDQDLELVSKYKWGANYINNNVISTTKINGKRLNLSIFIMNPPKGMIVDHINGDRFNNTRKNLRICTNLQNTRNCKLSVRNSSGYKGVHWHIRHKKWIARITVNYHKINLGDFKNPKEAAQAYNEAAIKYFGEFARLNRI